MKFQQSTMKLDLLSNATVVEDAIRFVTDKDARGKSKADPPAPVMEEEKQKQEHEDNDEREQDNRAIEQQDNGATTTIINQVF